jgi:hypothetical protein
MSVVEQKKELIRAAVQELESPASLLSTSESMQTLCSTVCFDFDDQNGSIGDFMDDDGFKDEIFSARVIQVVITAAKVNEEYDSHVYYCAGAILSMICFENTELTDTFVALDGVEFLLESLEAFSSDQLLLSGCISGCAIIMPSLNANESADFAAMLILEKLVDVFELNYQTADELLYYKYCLCVGNSLFHPSGVRFEVKKESFQRMVSHLWNGVIKHKYDEDAQKHGRRLLYLLVGTEAAKEMIDHAEMHHCEDEDCAGCA